MNTISFFASSAKAPIFNRTEFRQGMAALIESKGKILGEISYIFCTDEELLQINRKHLQHDTYTDVITFGYTESIMGFEDGTMAGGKTQTQKKQKHDREIKAISGDIFISTERVRENARIFGVTFKQELQRVMVHGVLHLLGFKDKTPTEEKEMRAAENDAIQRFFA
jgi:rRNA maturation RNase YbeY